MNKVIQIFAAGSHYHEVGEALPELKELTQQVTGKSFRRIGRFIQLAMIGVSRCSSLKVPSTTAVYLASGRGDLELTVDIMKELYVNAQSPKPLSFVNTVSNAACFYVAQLLGLKSRSNYLCNKFFAFETALQLAMVDIKMGSVSSALVGTVDVATQPLEEHRRRLNLGPSASIGEGSHWLWIGTSDPSQPAIATLSAARHFNGHDSLLDWVQSIDLNNVLLSRGQFIADSEWSLLTTRIHHRPIFEYRRNKGYYDSQSGAAIGAFLEATTKSSLLHINSDGAGRYAIMMIDR